MFYCIKSFYAPLKRFLDVFYGLSCLFCLHARIHVREKTKKERQKKSSKELFSLWISFLFWQKAKKRGSSSLPLRTV